MKLIWKPTENTTSIDQMCENAALAMATDKYHYVMFPFDNVGQVALIEERMRKLYPHVKYMFEKEHAN